MAWWIRAAATARYADVVASLPLSGIHILQGEEVLRCYQFNTCTAKHYFCSICGIYTHHQRRSNPAEYGYNLACLEGVNPFELGEVPTRDGVHRSSGSTGLNKGAHMLLFRPAGQCYSLAACLLCLARGRRWSDSSELHCQQGARL